ncbi:MAG: MBOAT family O-acyltransferase [Peptoanaerobacter stomatis]|uniref:MBOAT family O-acyltransferase n=1 Tax=Peptoanaerobacter stomatis TaxID=796937 RepID=UPI003FA03A37
MVFLNPIFWMILLVILPIYYSVKSINVKNAILAIFSIFWYIRYAEWSSLYLLTTIVTTWVYGYLYEKYKNSKTVHAFAWFLGIGINLGILLVLKYNSLLVTDKLTFWVPLGLSFYTFQALGYCIDIRNGNCEREKNIWNHILFLCFIPQMVTGPISRKTQLGGEFLKGKRFDYEMVIASLYRMTWGFFKKIVVANNLGVLVSAIYVNYDSVSGVLLAINAMLYVVQLFCDFSGCMDIAIGAAGLFGIEVVENFNKPFMAKNVSELWRRWHITLGTWARDYVFYPILLFVNRKTPKSFVKKLGKKKFKKLSTYMALIILWSIVGLWHGADFKYWIGNGMLYAVIIILGEVLTPVFNRIIKLLKIDTESKSYEYFQRTRTFLIFCIGNIFFNLTSVEMAFNVLSRIVTNFVSNISNYAFYSSMLGNEKLKVIIGLVGMAIFLLLSVFEVDIKDKMRVKNVIFRWLNYAGVVIVIFLSFILQNGGYGDSLNFIYMQF